MVTGLDYPLKTGFSRTHTLVPRLQLRLAGRGQLSFTLFSFSCGEVHGQCTSMLLAEHGAIMNLLPPTYVASMYVKVLSTCRRWPAAPFVESVSYLPVKLH